MEGQKEKHWIEKGNFVYEVENDGSFTIKYRKGPSKQIFNLKNKVKEVPISSSSSSSYKDSDEERSDSQRSNSESSSSKEP